MKMHVAVTMSLTIPTLVDLGEMTLIGSVYICVAFAKCSSSTVNTVTVTVICSFFYRSATQIETDPICVISPKAAKARRVSAIVAVAGLFTKKLPQCENSRANTISHRQFYAWF